MDVLKGKVAVVTGAGSGMGAITARLFAEEGAKVVLGDISGNQESVAKEIGQGALPIHADVSKSSDVKRMIDTARSEFGRLDILCNIAGIVTTPLRHIVEFAESDYVREFDVHLRGCFLTMKHAIPHMIEDGGGSIVNFASVGAITAYPGSAPYSAMKAGIIQLSRVTAAEYGNKGIRINVILPGMIETPMVAEVAANASEVPLEGEESVAGLTERIMATTPLGRMGQPIEVCRAVLFLASDAASFVTGQALAVDGGHTIY